jgi:hypothetical protein
MTTIYNRHLMAKIETTKGTDSVPVVGTNDIRIRSGKISSTPEILERNNVKATMGPQAHLVSPKRLFTLELEIELKPSGAAGTAVEYGPLLRACGLDETIVASTSVAYDPLTASHKSVSIYWYEDGLLHKLLGAVGKVSLDAQIGQVGIYKLTMMAPFLEPTAVACPASASMVFQSAAPLIFNSADVINDGAAIKVGAFSFEDGNDLQHHYATGLSEIVIAGRKPKLKFTKDSISTAAEWTALTAGTNVSFSATIGASAGNRLVLTAPIARRENITPGVRADRPTLEVAYGMFESAGDDAFKFLFN